MSDELEDYLKSCRRAVRANQRAMREWWKMWEADVADCIKTGRRYEYSENPNPGAM